MRVSCGVVLAVWCGCSGGGNPSSCTVSRSYGDHVTSACAYYVHPDEPNNTQLQFVGNLNQDPHYDQLVLTLGDHLGTGTFDAGAGNPDTVDVTINTDIVGSNVTTQYVAISGTIDVTSVDHQLQAVLHDASFLSASDTGAEADCKAEIATLTIDQPIVDFSTCFP